MTSHFTHYVQLQLSFTIFIEIALRFAKREVAGGNPDFDFNQPFPNLHESHFEKKLTLSLNSLLYEIPFSYERIRHR
jgi:hypothetical protein